MFINLSGFFIKKGRDHINITHGEFVTNIKFLITYQFYFINIKNVYALYKCAYL